jgi:predicted ester cyclase
MDHAAAARRMYDVLNAGDVDGYADGLADDFVEHEELPGGAPGTEGAKAFFQGFIAAFPDLRFIAEDVISSGDRIVVRAIATDDGLAREHRGVFDAMKMMQQLGVVPDGPPA